MRALLVAALAAPLLSGCVIYANEGGDKDVVVRAASHGDLVRPPLEAVRNARIQDGRLIVRVDSNGCTEVSDFAVELTSTVDGWTEAAVNRTDQDLCKALVPDGVEVSWSFSELGVEPGTPLRLLNPTRL
ncbi:hypothetical protein GCM10009422_01030 [Brevundimonas kwangchunensis]|uniref:Lipoprotein n=1 Tax=Brevundimonas kwangchunensis TaxID=322163 RepID=A0ABN1GEV1_9CAUL